jgi:guanidinopropionase
VHGGHAMTNDSFFQPVSGFDSPRFAGVPTFMRLPMVGADHPRLADVQIGLVGVPWDGGTTNRPGARHGPRALRDASTMMRAENGVTGVRPFQAARCADLGDVNPNPADLMDTLARITQAYAGWRDRGIRPLTAGGDHLTTLPILRALAADGPLGLIQCDSHTDLFHSYFGGAMYTHGTPFRRAVEEGLLDPHRMTIIGVRGTTYDREDRDFAKATGIRVIDIAEFHARGPADVGAEAAARAGQGATYLSFDIDFVDPAYAPGTGTPEVGGPTSWQALEVLRTLTAVNFVGADVVEVSPPFDVGGTTAYLAANVMFEILCLMAVTG